MNESCVWGQLASDDPYPFDTDVLPHMIGDGIGLEIIQLFSDGVSICILLRSLLPIAGVRAGCGVGH
jgi:hypothetical protein